MEDKIQLIIKSKATRNKNGKEQFDGYWAESENGIRYRLQKNSLSTKCDSDDGLYWELSSDDPLPDGNTIYKYIAKNDVQPGSRATVEKTKLKEAIDENGKFYRVLSASATLIIGNYANAQKRKIEAERLKKIIKNELADQNIQQVTKALVKADFNQDAPYHFINLRGENTPLIEFTHHNHYRNSSFSGTLNISIECLTNCHFGNFQTANGESIPSFHNGHALINGSSIMGLLRTNVSSLVMAPMSRVSEKKMTYRPNRQILLNSQVKSYAAVMNPEKNSGFESSNELLIDIYNLADVTFDQSEGKQYRYIGGTDGTGELADLFKTGGTVPNKVYMRKSATPLYRDITINEKTIEKFNKTTDYLTDPVHGNYSSTHPLIGKASKSKTDLGNKRKASFHQLVKSIKNTRDIKNWLTNNQSPLIIFIEAEITNGEFKVLSFGNNRLYHWLYKDTVRTIDGDKNRPELTLQPEERFLPHAPPSKVNLARKLFGDIQEAREHVPDGKSTKCTYRQFAGRVNCNYAVEIKSDEVPHVNQGPSVFLKFPGAPKPTSPEFYLYQSSQNRTTQTWGFYEDDPDSQLAGRKVYRHQRRMQALTDIKEKNTPALKYVSRAGTRYRCRVRFASLDMIELGTLLLSIDPNLLLTKHTIAAINSTPESKSFIEKQLEKGIRPFAHKMGRARNLGLGSVRFRLDSHKIHPNSEGSNPANDSLIFKAVEEALVFLSRHQNFDKNLLEWLILKNFDSAPEQLTYPTSSNRKGDKNTLNFHRLHRDQQLQCRAGKAVDEDSSYKPPLKPITKLSEADYD